MSSFLTLRMLSLPKDDSNSSISFSRHGKRVRTSYYSSITYTHLVISFTLSLCLQSDGEKSDLHSFTFSFVHFACKVMAGNFIALTCNLNQHQLLTPINGWSDDLIAISFTLREKRDPSLHHFASKVKK